MPTGVVFDSENHIFIADCANKCIFGQIDS